MTLLAANAAATPAIGVGGLFSVTLALLGVLAVIFALAWLARRARMFGGRTNGSLEVLATQPLGPKERAVLLRVGKRQILVGVAPGQVNALHVLEEPLETPRSGTASSAARPSFAQLLKRSLGK